MSLQDLQATEQYLTYLEGLLQQAAEAISTAIAYADQHANEVNAGQGIRDALSQIEQSVHALEDARSDVHGQVQAEIETEQQTANEVYGDGSS